MRTLLKRNIKIEYGAQIQQTTQQFTSFETNKKKQ